ELVIGRWSVQPKDDRPPAFELAVFKVCSGTPGLVARMRGPVTQLGNIATNADAEKASAAMQTGDNKGDVKLSYWFGTVQIDQPSWVKPGLGLPSENKLRLPVNKAPGHAGTSQKHR